MTLRGGDRVTHIGKMGYFDERNPAVLESIARLIKAAHKKGVSVMIGYVLLISFAVVMAGLVYHWAKTYIPREEVKCQEGVSIFIIPLDDFFIVVNFEGST